MDNSQWIFNTPDETANYFFIKTFFETGQMQSFEPLNAVSGTMSLVHPRSTTVIDNFITPATFLGFILAMRMFAKIFSFWFIPFIIPLFSAFAILAFFYLIKETFNEKIAFWSSLALAVMPAFWYYSSRSLFNNLLFLDFTIIGFSLLVMFIRKKELMLLAISALFLGLALTIRTTEAVWIIAILIILFATLRQQLRWHHGLLLFFIIILSFLPVLGYQYHMYGNPLAFGYAPKIAIKAQASIMQTVGNLALPFGFSPINILRNIYHYFFKMFFWLSVPAFLGGLLLIFKTIKKKAKPEEKAYLLFAVIISVSLLLYYGSWWFFNNLMAKPLIGSSQVRYFLPMYVIGIPLVIYFWDEVLNLVKNKKIRLVAGAAIVLATLGFSVNCTVFAGEESLTAIYSTVRSYHDINKKAVKTTENDSVIVSSYSDKVFFPSRKVIFYWQDPKYLANISKITAQTKIPVYFYSISDNELEYIENNSSLKTELAEKINDKEGLYLLKNK
ncbi:MAG: glycosyltransferase family 39 protein [Patescibacteria group bacterium]